MMVDFTLHKQFLNNLGVNLTEEHFEALAAHVESTLSQRVIDEVVLLLDDDQAAELAGLKGADSDTLGTWLSQNVTDLKEIIENEVDILLGELAENADRL